MNQGIEETNSMPTDRASLLGRIEGEWSALMDVVDGLAAGRMSLPGDEGWSIKDHLAHLDAWHGYLIDYHLGGRPPHEAMGLKAADIEKLDEDGLNAVLQARSRDLPSDRILADLALSHRRVVATLEGIPFEALLKPRYTDDPEKRPVILWVLGNTAEHYQEHRQIIQSLLAAQDETQR